MTQLTKSDFIVCSALLLLCAAYWVPFNNLFPLVEFRDWINWSSGLRWRDVLVDMVVRNHLYSRDVSLATTRWMGGACGTDIPCLNTLTLIPVGAAAVLLYLMARLFALSRTVSFLMGMVWLYSFPVLDAVAWQATIHDRFALFFALLTLLIGGWWLRQSAGWRLSLLGNLAIAIPLVLAYNSKESAFFLGPALALGGLLLTPPGLWGKCKQSCCLVLPLMYAAYHNYQYFSLLQQDPAWSEHVAGRAWQENLPVFLSFAGGRYAAYAVIGLILIASIIVFLSGIRNRHLSNQTIMRWLWLLGVFVFALLIPIRAQYQCPYYIYVPLAMLALGLAHGSQIVSARLGRFSSWGAASILSVFLVFSLLQVKKEFQSTYQPLIDESKNLREALPVIRTHIGAPITHPVVFVLPNNNSRAYKFVEGRDLGAWWRFVQPIVASEEFQGKPVVTTTELHGKEGGQDYRIVFDQSMNLLSISLGNDILYRKEK